MCIRDRVKQLIDMGFSEEVAVKALADCGGDENAALEKLLAQSG